MVLHLLAARDLIVLWLTFNSFHITLNLGADSMHTAHVSECPYATWYSSAFSLFILCACTAAITANAFEWRHERSFSLAVDAMALPIGMFWLATTKPSGWYASATVPGCDMFEVPWAFMLFLLGETLTFGSAVRLGVLAFNTGLPRVSVGILVMGSFAISGLMWIMAIILRHAYDIA